MKVWALLVVVAIAGCVEDEAATVSFGSSTPSAPPVTATSAAPVAQPTVETGSISVLVTDREMVPIGTVEVALVGLDATTFTDAEGRATFNDLQPSSYTVVAAKPGYSPVEKHGRVVDVAAGEITETRLTLEPIAVVDAASSYSATLHFRGFIACSFDGEIIGYTSYCGRGLNVAGQSIARDPNDNSTHPWSIDNNQIQAFIVEAEWQPSISALGTEMMIRTGASIGCSPYACTIGSSLGTSAAGASPLRAATFEQPDNRITNTLGGAAYPRQVWSEGRAYCGPTCTLNLFLNQPYDMWVSVFYGKEPPQDWSALPE
jgi:hypothetical protein